MLWLLLHSEKNVAMEKVVVAVPRILQEMEERSRTKTGEVHSNLFLSICQKQLEQKEFSHASAVYKTLLDIIIAKSGFQPDST